ncbi:Bcr/CflA family efflux MFS transporter [Hasllibacter sp. MH4015]|uniref:Bcr/CflA family efflux MFS transporter n=1 Tax=Hasllibacter sp. MH4015 TaxID=2854029 RepID=UPI001CD4E2DE|nr:Bcr/CflA family efflux MFS transporter [Hasllibacter sp. MH4015]
MQSSRHPPRLLTLILLSGLTTLSLNMFLPSLPAIAAALEADYALVSLSIAGYLAVTALAQLVVGPLSDRIGRRPVVLGGLAIFVIASLVCAIAQSIWVFLAARLAQSAISAGYAMSLAITRDTTAPEAAAARIATIAMFMALAPMLGPMLGGLIETFLGWRASFLAYALAGSALFAWCWHDLGETAGKADPDRPRQRAWTLLAQPRFWAFALCTAFSTGAFYIFITGAPLVASATFGIGAAGIGVAIGSITAGYMTGSFLTTRLAARVGVTGMMLVGRITACLGLSLGLIAVAFGAVTPLTFFAATICVGLGNGLTMPSSNSGALSVRPDLAGTAAGVMGALTVGTGAALTALAGALVSDHPAPAVLLGLMLSASAVGLLAAMAARRGGV